MPERHAQQAKRDNSRVLKRAGKPVLIYISKLILVEASD